MGPRRVAAFWRFETNFWSNLVLSCCGVGVTFILFVFCPKSYLLYLSLKSPNKDETVPYDSECVLCVRCNNPERSSFTLQFTRMKRCQCVVSVETIIYILLSSCVCLPVSNFQTFIPLVMLFC